MVPPDLGARLFALAAVAGVGGGLAGCGAVFHASQTVEIATQPADKAVIYQSGNELPKNAEGNAEAPYFLNQNMGGPLVAIAPGKRMVAVVPETEVSAAAIICDVLWSLTIIGVAAPISDAALGTFTATESPVEVAFEADAAGDNPMPVYVIGGESIPATEAAPAPATPPAATGAPDAAPPSLPTEPAPPPPR